MSQQEINNSGPVPKEIALLRDRYQERREQSLLDAAAAAISLNGIVNGDAINFDQITPQMREAFELSFPNDVLEERLSDLDTADPAELAGFMSNWRGKYFEVLVRDELNSGARPSYTLADVLALPFEDASFTIVSIAFGLRNVTDPRRALGEFGRVLRPGGRVVILEFSEPANPVLRVLNRLYCQHIMPITATLLAGDRSGAYRYLPRSVTTFADRDGLAAMMEEAGFRGISRHPMTFGVCVAYLGAIPGGLSAGRVR